MHRSSLYEFKRHICLHSRKFKSVDSDVHKESKPVTQHLEHCPKSCIILNSRIACCKAEHLLVYAFA